MIVCSYRDGPDGQARIVTPDFTTSTRMRHPSLQRMLDLGFDGAEGDPEPLDPDLIASPLPRAYQFLDGSAYVNHVELVRRARGAPMPESFWTNPLMYQGGSDGFLGPRDPVRADPAWGVDFEAEVAVVTDRVAMGTGPEAARAAIRFVMLCNDWSLRYLIPDEISKGFGFVQSKPACAFSPFARTVDDCPGWDGARFHGRICIDLNGRPFGRLEAGHDMTFDFAQLVAHAARTRDLGPGTIIGSGTVSNKLDGGPGRTIADGGAGYACIAEQRTVETLRDGAPATPFLQPGDRVAIWAEDAEGRDLFGRISQEMEAP